MPCTAAVARADTSVNFKVQQTPTTVRRITPDVGGLHAKLPTAASGGWPVVVMDRQSGATHTRFASVRGRLGSGPTHSVFLAVAPSHAPCPVGLPRAVGQCRRRGPAHRLNGPNPGHVC